MKKIKLFMLVAAVSFATVSVTSCSSDDDSAPVNEQPTATVEGKWYYSKEGMSVMGMDQLQNYMHAEGCTKDHVELMAEGVFKEHDYYMESACEHSSTTGTWSKTDNMVTVTLDGVAEEWEIVNHTADELKVRKIYSTQGGMNTYWVTVFTKN